MIIDARCTSTDMSPVVRTDGELGRWKVQSNLVTSGGDVVGDLSHDVSTSVASLPRAGRTMTDGNGSATVSHGTWRWNLSTDEMEWSPEVFEIFGLDPSADASRLVDALAGLCDRVGDLRTVAGHVIRTGRRFEGTQTIVVSGGAAKQLRGVMVPDDDDPSAVRGVLYDLSGAHGAA